jgi:hypothetical protein
VIENVSNKWKSDFDRLLLEKSLLESNLTQIQTEKFGQSMHNNDKHSLELSKLQMESAMMKSDLDSRIANLRSEVSKLSMDNAFLKSSARDTKPVNSPFMLTPQQTGSSAFSGKSGKILSSPRSPFVITDDDLLNELKSSTSRTKHGFEDVNFPKGVSIPLPKRKEGSDAWGNEEIQTNIENFILKNKTKSIKDKIVRKPSIIVQAEKPPPSPKKADATPVRSKLFNESLLLKHDKLELNKSPMIFRILQTNGENPKTVEIFSESIARINSLGKRKNKLLMITDRNLYVITSNKNNNYEEKRVINLNKIGQIKVHSTSRGIFQVCVREGHDEVLESFDRNSLCLQIQRKA